MAISPIISNLPILNKFLKSDQSADTTKADSADANPSQDRVELSSEAQELLSAEDVQTVATQARDQLKENEGATLGLDPDFSV